MYIEAAIPRSVSRKMIAEKYHRSDNTVSSSPTVRNKSIPAPAARSKTPHTILTVKFGSFQNQPFKNSQQRNRNVPRSKPHRQHLSQQPKNQQNLRDIHQRGNRHYRRQPTPSPDHIFMHTAPEQQKRRIGKPCHGDRDRKITSSQQPIHPDTCNPRQNNRETDESQHHPSSRRTGKRQRK